MKILVAIDGSDLSLEILPFVSKLAGGRKAQVKLLAVVDQRTGLRESGVDMT